MSKPSKVIPFASSGIRGWLNVDTGRWLPAMAGADPAAEQVERPKENLIRVAVPAAIELRAEGDGADGPVMAGHFAVFNQWTEINSMWEGNFLERFAPGSMKKTIRESRDKMKVLFQHGMDPVLGDKPLGPIQDLREDDVGAFYEVPLLDAPYVRENVLPGLEAGLYGASFRFRVMREEWVEEPDPSDDNPQGLPERTVKEAQVAEFGPVTFPAYDAATAGLRSLTDDFIMRCFARDPERLREMFETAQRAAENPDDDPGETADAVETTDAPPDDTSGRREQDTPSAPAVTATRKGARNYLTPRKEHPSWLLP